MMKKRGSLLPLFFTFTDNNWEITRLFSEQAASIIILQEGEKTQ